MNWSWPRQNRLLNRATRQSGSSVCDWLNSRTCATTTGAHNSRQSYTGPCQLNFFALNYHKVRPNLTGINLPKQKLTRLKTSEYDNCKKVKQTYVLLLFSNNFLTTKFYTRIGLWKTGCAALQKLTAASAGTSKACGATRLGIAFCYRFRSCYRTIHGRTQFFNWGASGNFCANTAARRMLNVTAEWALNLRLITVSS